MTDLVGKLVEAGANINAITIGGDTALMKAIFYTNADCVITLLKYGADPFSEDKTGKNALKIS